MKKKDGDRGAAGWAEEGEEGGGLDGSVVADLLRNGGSRISTRISGGAGRPGEHRLIPGDYPWGLKDSGDGGRPDAVMGASTEGEVRCFMRCMV